MKTIIGCAVIAVAFFASACEDEKTVSEMVPAEDVQFMRTAAMTNRAEIELATVAITRTDNKDVKAFALKMVDNHTRAFSELQFIAKNKGIEITNDIDSNHKLQIQQLQTLSGYQLDRQYLKAQIADHQILIGIFENHEAEAKDESVRTYTYKYLPKVQENFALGQQLQATVAPSDPDPASSN